MKKEPSPDKMEQIIRAAQRRFGAFGMEKTTMQEIAADLGMTKGSLYYYFQDKERLYLHVIKQEFKQFIDSINSKLEKLSDPGEMLLEYVRVRTSLFQSFINLSRFRIEGVSGLKTIMQEFWQESREQEGKIIERIIAKGIQEGILEDGEIAMKASLFLDLLKSLRIMSLRHKQFLQLDGTEFDQLLEKSLNFTRIYFRGLSVTS